MAAPLPSGSSLQALPVVPQINPALGVVQVDPIGNAQKGIDFAGVTQRLGQLRSKIELEDAQRKADAAKAKAQLLEADIMQRDAETQQALKLAQLQASLDQTNAGVAQTQAGTVNAGIAGDIARVTLDQTKKDNEYKEKVRNAGLAQLGIPGASPSATGSTGGALANVAPEVPIVTAPEAATPVAAAGAPAAVAIPFKPTHSLASWIRQPMAAEILNTQAPVSTAALAKKLGVDRKTRTWIDPVSKSEYEVDVQEGPGGEIFDILSTPRFVKVSPLQADVDKKTADDISEFNTGGKEKAVAQIEKLQGVIDVLNSGDIVAASGPIPSLTPEWLEPWVQSDKALAIPKDVRQVIQNSLRAILGSQFTEKEGERIIDAAFSKQLSEESNAARLSILKNELQALLTAKSAQVDYFRDHGTLSGFTPASGGVPSIGLPLDSGLPKGQVVPIVSSATGNIIRVDPKTGKKYQKINGVVTEVGQ